MIKHKHHIIPRHAGGTDDPSNLVELTIEEHAEAHKQLFEQYGRWQDELAWKGLAGLIGKDEILEAKWQNMRGENHWSFGVKRPEHAEAMRILYTGKGNPMYGKTAWNKGLDKSDLRVAAYSVPHPNKIRRGADNGMFGVKRPEVAKRMSENKYTLGMKWWNNGILDVFAEEAPSSAWTQGRMFRKRNRKKGNQ